MTLNGDWVTEISEQHGAAYSLQLGQKVHSETTPFQTIEIYETKTFGNLMLIDGFMMVSTRENFLYHEMMSHPALFTHPNPKNVLVIGGGDCGTLKEVLRHSSVTSALQVEIDERVTRVAEIYFPELCESNNDPRASFYFGDGIAWVKEAPAESLDIIIVDSTDPIGPAEGLFSAPFYRDCFKALRPDGILVQQSESPLYHLDLIKSMHGEMRKADFSKTKTLHFPQMIYPSGWWSATMASKSVELTAFRSEDAKQKPFATRYYNAGIHQGALALPEFMKGL